MHKYSESKNNSIRARAFEGNHSRETTLVSRRLAERRKLFTCFSLGVIRLVNVWVSSGCKPLLSMSNAFNNQSYVWRIEAL